MRTFYLIIALIAATSGTLAEDGNPDTFSDGSSYTSGNITTYGGVNSHGGWAETNSGVTQFHPAPGHGRPCTTYSGSGVASTHCW